MHRNGKSRDGTGKALPAPAQGPLRRDFKNEEELARWREDGERDACSRQREEQVQSPEVRERVRCFRDPRLFIWLETEVRDEARWSCQAC